MTIENPPKLHVIVGSLCGPRAFVSADEAAWDRERLGRDSSEWVTKPQAYVREDVAEAAVAEERQDKNLKVGLLKGERDALRRERDALLSRVEKLRATLAHIEHTTRKSMDRADVWDAAGEALLGDDALAASGKGVG